MCACFVVCQCEITDGDRGHHGNNNNKKATNVRCKLIYMVINTKWLGKAVFKIYVFPRGRGRSIIGGAHIHIFVFTDCKNNRFQKKLMMHNTNI